jgi:hypothetical protein
MCLQLDVTVDAWLATTTTTTFNNNNNNICATMLKSATHGIAHAIQAVCTPPSSRMPA